MTGPGRSMKALYAAVFLLMAPAAVAQVLPQQIPQGSPIPRISPPAPAATPSAPTLPASPPAAEMPDRTVQVTTVSVSGATAFPAAELQGDTADLIGPAVALQRIESARNAMLRRYRAQGFVLVTVSAKLDAAGHLQFTVTEGRIASVKLDGDIGPAATQVLRFLNRLTEQQPIKSATLERFLLLAQDVPGVTLRAVLEASADETGALD